MEIAKIFNSADGKRRVLVLRRPDGNFNLRAEKWYRDLYEGKLIAEGWAPIPARTSIFATLEIAEREAKARYPWIAYP